MERKTKTERTRYLLAVITGICMLTLCKGDVKAAASYEAEDNNSYETANSISLGNSVTGNQSDDHDVDYYKVVPESNGKITINFNHTYEDAPYNGWRISLVHYADGNYEELSSTDVVLTDNEKITLPFIGAKAGNSYYIVVKCRNDNSYCYTSADYTISTFFEASEYMEREGNDSYSDATSIELGNSCTGVLNNPYDGDYYLVRPDTDGKISIQFKHTYEDSYNGWHISLVHYTDGSYEELSSSDIALTGNEKITLPFIGSKAGDSYYIVVKCRDDNSYYHTSAAYTISTGFKKSAYTEKEGNDTYATATPAKINTTYTGIISSRSDKDYYKIVAPAKGTLSANFTFPYYADNSCYWNVYIYQYANGEYKQLANASIYQGSEATSVDTAKVNVKKNGIYYIVVEEGYEVHSGTDDYKIKPTFHTKAPTKLTLKKSGKSVKISWSKAQGASGYEIYYKASSGGKYKKITTTSKTSFTFKKAASGKKCYFKVRAYTNIGKKKYYSEYTNEKKVKM